MPNPFGSDNFYQEQPKFENVGEVLNKKAKESSGLFKKWGFLLVIIIILAMVGGGFYYWWFYVRSQNNSSAPVGTNAPTESKSSAPSEQPLQIKTASFASGHLICPRTK